MFHGHLRYGHETISELTRLAFHTFVIVRDLRDVAVSEFFHKFHMSRDPQMDHLRSLDERALFEFCNVMKWSTSLYAAHDLLSWKESGDCVMLRYEDLSRDPASVLSAALRSASLQVDRSIIEYAVCCNAFERATAGRLRGTADNSSPLRKGIVGDWRNHLSDETSARIIDRFAPFYAAFYPEIVKR